MDEHLLHDPRTKQQIKDLLYNFLYAPVLKQFNMRLQDIISKNAVMLGSSSLAFSYKGCTYTNEDGPLPRKLDRLNSKLHPFMDDYLKNIKELNNHELPYVLGFIRQVLNSSNSLQDYLLVLPSAVHHPIQTLIDSCPCKTIKLTPEGINNLQIQNQESIIMMKRRMVQNLLI